MKAEDMHPNDLRYTDNVYLEGYLAGIKEVVEWVEEHKFWFATNGYRVWQSKLKEWGANET